MTLFDIPTDLDPGPGPGASESPDARRSRLNRNLLARGIHPATRLSLLDAGWGFSCAGCTHIRRVGESHRAWFKCDIGRLGLSRSAASDIRRSWPACTRYRMDAG